MKSTKMEYLVQLLLSVTLFVRLSTCFNVDTKFPVIKQEQAGSYFGYSIAQHRSSTAGLAPKILVGAPLAQSTSAQQSGYIKTGALYQCDIDIFNNIGTTCQELQYPDTKDAPSDLGSSWRENKTDMWLGVSIKSAGLDGEVVGCAHRYNAYSEEQVAAVGMCYRYDSSLNIRRRPEYHSPCFGLGAVRENSVVDGYGMCQAGLSTDFMDDDLVMGLPGAIAWKGSLKWINSKERNLKQSEVDVPFEQNDPIYPIDSYLGSSTVIGRNLLAGNKLIVCAGAPGQNDTGHVILYTLHTTIDTNNDANIEFIRQSDDVLKGTQFGESFGQSLETIDINKDGNTALMVGAPFYRNQGGVNGAVYFYPNFGDGIVKDNARLRLTVDDCKYDDDLKCNNAMFGFSLADLGDINDDGFNDLAVGAPYHGDGAVYVYNGLKDGYLSLVPSQVILASDVSGALLKGFGISLSSGYDIDNQGYTDIVVGSYQSSHVVILRSRPVVTISGRVELVKEFVDPLLPCTDPPTTTQPCVKFKVCLKAATHTDTPASEVLVNYDITLDTGYVFLSARRVSFELGQKQSTKAESTTLSINGAELCKPYTSFVERSVDYHKPIIITLKYSLEENSSPIFSDLNQYAIMDKNAPKAKPAKVEFKRDCETDTCDTDLGVRAEFDDDAVLNQDEAGPDAFFFNSNQLKKLKLKVTLTVSTNTGSNDPAYNPRLYVKLPAVLQYTEFSSSSGTASCNMEIPNLICDFGKTPIKSGKQETVHVVLDTYNLTKTFASINVSADTSSNDVVRDNNQANLRIRVVTVTDLEILGSANIGGSIKYGKGPIKGVVGLKTDAEIGDLVEHTYTIFNGKGGHIPKIQVEINWPYQLPSSDPNTGKYLLYLINLPRLESQDAGNGNLINISAAMIKKLINPQNLVIVDAGIVTINTGDSGGTGETIQYNRKKRSTQKSALTLGRGETQSKGTAKLNCHDGSAQCYKFKYEFVNLKPSAEITIRFRARVWNSTLLEVYGNKYSAVEITSDGKVSINPEFDIMQPTTDNDFTNVTTLAEPDISLTAPPEVPIWIYIVAAVGGLLLLVVLIVIFWKCGFFKRNRPTHAVTVDKHGEKYQAVDQNETIDS